MTPVDRHSSCILAWRVAYERTEAALQAMLDETLQAERYYSDQFALYRNLLYTPERHTAVADKSQTYRVGGGNAELRHYLARLARRSRRFSRCIQALWRAMKLFVYLWNRRQLWHQHFPKYPAHLCQFVG